MEKSRKGGRWPLWGVMQFVGISPYKALASNVGMFIDIKHKIAVTRNKETGQCHYPASVPSPSLNSTFLHFYNGIGPRLGNGISPCFLRGEV